MKCKNIYSIGVSNPSGIHNEFIDFFPMTYAHLLTNLAAQIALHVCWFIYRLFRCLFAASIYYLRLLCGYTPLFVTLENGKTSQKKKNIAAAPIFITSGVRLTLRVFTFNSHVL